MIPFLLLTVALILTVSLAAVALQKSRQLEIRLAELDRALEYNGVMRNLLMDIVENETVLVGLDAHTTKAERVRRVNALTARRRELLGETLAVLQRSKRAVMRVRDPVA